MKTRFKNAAAFLLISAVLLTGAHIPASASETGGGSDEIYGSGTAASSLRREEVIYAVLDASGVPTGIYAVTAIYADEAGVVYDYGDYKKVINLTGTEPILYEDGRITADIKDVEKPFYYQGDMQSTALPWSFDISYYLNEEKLDADKAAGSDGEMKINIKTSKNDTVNDAFYQNYMLQITVTLDSGICSDIEAEGATEASSGKSKSLTFTVMPDSDGDCTVSFNTVSFEMKGISIAALPFTSPMDMSGIEGITGGLTEGLTELSDAVAALKDGADELQGASEALSLGASEAASGIGGISDAVISISSGSEALTAGSSQIGDALDMIAAQLAASDGAAEELGALPDALCDAADALFGISSQLRTAAAGYGELTRTLSDAINAIPEPLLTAEELAALSGAVYGSEHTDTVASLIAAYEAAARVRGMYSAGVGDALEGASSGMAAMADGIDMIAAGLSEAAQRLLSANTAESLGALSSGISALSSSYSDFHLGLMQYFGGVDAIAANIGAAADGVKAISDGAGELAGGIGELADGIGRMRDETAAMPDRIDSEISTLTGAFDSLDLEPVSFISEQNEGTSLVQFVAATPDIAPAGDAGDDTSGAEENGRTSFWEKLKALFD